MIEYYDELHNIRVICIIISSKLYLYVKMVIYYININIRVSCEYVIIIMCCERSYGCCAKVSSLEVGAAVYVVLHCFYGWKWNHKHCCYCCITFHVIHHFMPVY